MIFSLAVRRFSRYNRALSNNCSEPFVSCHNGVIPLANEEGTGFGHEILRIRGPESNNVAQGFEVAIAPSLGLTEELVDMAVTHSFDTSKRTERPHALGLSLTVAAVGILGLIFNACAILIGFHHSLYTNGFRQTQTAISVDSLLHGASFFRYETPVLGRPWAIPFEFPLYQGIVAFVIRLLGTRMEETGRAVSILFFYLCFFPLTSILHRLRIRGIQVIPLLGIVLVTPVYIYWSRAFMIESAALFLSLMYLEQMFRLTLGESPWQYRHMVGAAAFGILGGLVKVTTFAPYYVLGFGLALWQAWKLNRGGEIRRPTIGAAAVLCGLLPVVFIDLWTSFADGVKAQNPLGAGLTSKALHSWNFGTIAQRFQLHSYQVLLQRSVTLIGHPLAVLLVVGVWMLNASSNPQPFKRWNCVAGVCVALYIGTTMLFFNLHVVHDYYPYSTALFLAVALGALIAPMLELPGWGAWVGVALLVIEMAACVHSYLRVYYPLQSYNHPGRPDAAAIIVRTTSPQSVILVTGLDWSSELPYQARRRAIMDANWAGLSSMTQAVKNTGTAEIAAVVACDARRNSDRLNALLEITGMNNPTHLQADNCDIYERVSSK